MRIYKIHKIASLIGEWWIQDGYSLFCDGDAGDLNHEAAAIQHAQSLLTSDDNFYDEDYEGWKQFKAKKIWESLSEEEKEETWGQPESDAEQFLLNHLETVGIDFNLFVMANGNHKDPRRYAMQNWGWKRMAGQLIETWTLTEKDLKSISRGISNAYGDQFQEDDDPEFDIEVSSNNRTFRDIPLSVIDRDRVEDLIPYSKQYSYSKRRKR